MNWLSKIVRRTSMPAIVGLPPSARNTAEGIDKPSGSDEPPAPKVAAIRPSRSGPDAGRAARAVASTAAGRNATARRWRRMRAPGQVQFNARAWDDNRGLSTPA
jgi:hypothetical protein